MAYTESGGGMGRKPKKTKAYSKKIVNVKKSGGRSSGAKVRKVRKSR